MKKIQNSLNTLDERFGDVILSYMITMKFRFR